MKMHPFVIADSSALLPGKAMAMIAFFGVVALFATRYAFASNDVLSHLNFQGCGD